MEYDLVISGGGIKFYYLLGLMREIKNLNIIRYSATSSGSIILPLIFCNLDENEIIKNYNFVKNLNKSKMDLIDIFLNNVLPDDVHKICSDKLYISITVFKNLYLQNISVSKFNSKKELIDTIKASCSIPFFVNNNLFFKYGNYQALDGCFTRNTPYFTDNLRKQIIVKIFLIEYQNLNIFSLETDYQLKYIQKGQNDFINFINNKKVKCIQWYDRYYKSNLSSNILDYGSHFIKKVNKFNLILVVLFIFFLIFIFGKLNKIENLRNILTIIAS